MSEDRGMTDPDRPQSADSPTADVSVRAARVDDAGDVASVQAATWRSSYAGVLPDDVLSAVTPQSLAPQWDGAIRTSPSPRHRVLVACEGRRVVGFASVAPGADPDADPTDDADLLELAVDPGHRGAGHGSRLLAAAVDVLRDAGFATARHWVNADDDEAREFLVSAGWAPDGATRELDLRGDGAVVVRQVRLHTGIRE
jgi:GNAT superfamily N-acetyltransferase